MQEVGIPFTACKRKTKEFTVLKYAWPYFTMSVSGSRQQEQEGIRSKLPRLQNASLLSNESDAF